MMNEKQKRQMEVVFKMAKITEMEKELSDDIDKLPENANMIDLMLIQARYAALESVAQKVVAEYKEVFAMK